MTCGTGPGASVPPVTSVRRIPSVADRLSGLPATGLVVDVLVVAVALGSVIRIWVQPVRPAPLVTLLALTATLPLLARRRFPLAAPLAALCAGCLGLTLVVPGALWEQLQFFFCALLCAWALGSASSRLRAVLGLGAALAVAVVSVVTDTAHHGVGDSVFGVAITAAAWLGGLLFGTRARQATLAERRAVELTAERDRRAAEAVAAERSRIARELHDVIAHTVSVMVVQAGAAERVLPPNSDQARQALAAVRESGKGALTELRHLLGLLRDADPAEPDGPQPTVAQLPALLGQVRAAGLDAELSVSGEPRLLSPGLDQAAYRIIQEALTNTLKHAGPAHALVELRWEPDCLALSVSDDGRPGTGVPALPGSGRGIVGMRERARLYGGELSAEPRPEGGFAVTARLPA